MNEQITVLRDDERTRCEVWSRVMGYHRPVSFWNPGKQSEHRERRYFVAIDSNDKVPTGRKEAAAQ
ncbi:anaerobic ribonucleoside-triphosphate reductase [Microbulbifer thermotolerans]|nr:anaerobic ribonucleoside-triphosphate reductase [Microbulbifer thermotolerans]WKT61379.1 anaerobic ribonucleoside-triphosphate reductase [Microbulbifer thermotolerans]